MARSSRTYARDARGRFASTPGGGKKAPSGLPRRQPRKAGTPPPKRRGLVTQRAAVRRASAKLKGLDTSGSYSGALKQRAQKGAVTRAGNRLAAAEQSGRRRIRTAAQPGIVRPGRQGRASPAAATPAGRPAVRGRQRLRMYSTGKDGIVLKKVFDAYKQNPFERFAGRNKVASNLQAATAWLAKRGQPIGEQSANNESSWIASARAGVKGVYLSAKNDFWMWPRTESKKHRISGWWSTGAPQGVLHHEIGHTRDVKALERYRQNPKGRARGYNKWRSLLSPSTGPTRAKKQEQEFVAIASRVSRYGATAPTEFVAETYAGLRTGQRYDREVMKLYRELMGSGDPALKARRSRRPRRPR